MRLKIETVSQRQYHVKAVREAYPARLCLVGRLVCLSFSFGSCLVYFG